MTALAHRLPPWGRVAPAKVSRCFCGFAVYGSQTIFKREAVFAQSVFRLTPSSRRSLDELINERR